MDAQDNGNGKVTLAKIDQKLDEIFRRLDKLDSRFDGFEARLHLDELAAQCRETRLQAIETHEEKQDEEIETLKSSDRKWSALAAVIGAAVGGIVGWFKV